MAHIATLYGTVGCHLCDDALAIIHPQIQELDIVLQEIDIAGNDTLELRYGIRIPVLVLNKQELSWPFSSEQVKTFFSALKD